MTNLQAAINKLIEVGDEIDTHMAECATTTQATGDNAYKSGTLSQRWWLAKHNLTKELNKME